LRSQQVVLFGKEQLTGLSRSRAARVVLFFVLGSLPAFFLFGDIRRTAVNVPFMDDWQFVPLLEKAKNGTLAFQELWAPHDEHRLLLPRIIIIAAMFASRGDYRVQCCISFLAVEIISLCFLWLLVRLNGERFGRRSALAGNYRFFQGNLVWVVTLPVIFFAPGILEEGARRKFAVSWIVLGLLAVGLYFHGLDHNSAAPAYAYGHEGVPPTFSTFQQLRERPGQTLLQMGLFIVGMFGNAVGRGFPVFDNLMLVRRAGELVLLIALAGLYAAWRKGVLRGRALPWACLLLFAFLTAAFVCIGRVWRGEYQPLTTRYTTFGAFCVVAVVMIVASVLFGETKETNMSAKRTAPFPASGKIDWDQALKWALGALVGIFLTVQWVNWRYGTNLMEEWNMARWRSRASLHLMGSGLYAPELEYRYLGGIREIFDEGAQTLEKLGMLNPPRATDLRLSKLGQDGGTFNSYRGQFERMDRLDSGGWHVSGYAVCHDNRPPDLILFCTRNENGEWVVRTTATPFTAPQYLRDGTRYDSFARA
jgi:hypothetical protein